MKLPKLEMPSARKAGEGKGAKSLKMPPFLEDLYRDMRDRRLLLPVALLIVAIAAVPVLLKAPKEEPPAPAGFVPPEGAEAVAPAVLAEQEVGVRDYRERLEALKSKNPFASKFKLPAEGAAAGALTDTAATPASTEGTVASTGTGAVATDSGSTEPSVPADGSGTTTVTDEILVVAPRIDVRIGRQQKTHQVNDVKIGDILPHPRKAPMVVFIGTGEDTRFADLLVSSDVTFTDGEGRCRPSPDRCEFLRLKKGQKQVFIFGEQRARRSITVTDIREKVVDRRKVKSG